MAIKGLGQYIRTYSTETLTLLLASYDQRNDRTAKLMAARVREELDARAVRAVANS